MIDLLIHILIICLVFGPIWYVLSVIPLPHPFGQIARVVLIVLACIWVIYLLLGLAGSMPKVGRL